jgi:Cys-rich protein (TIGR01571 family)
MVLLAAGRDFFSACFLIRIGIYPPYPLPGDNVTKVDGGGCFVPCCTYFVLSSCFLCGLVAGPNRRQIRERYGLREAPCGDCLVHTCCAECAVCQDAYELKVHALLCLSLSCLGLYRPSPISYCPSFSASQHHAKAQANAPAGAIAAPVVQKMA